jgi:hypothetical protein
MDRFGDMREDNRNWRTEIKEKIAYYNVLLISFFLSFHSTAFPAKQLEGQPSSKGSESSSTRFWEVQDNKNAEPPRL